MTVVLTFTTLQLINVTPNMTSKVKLCKLTKCTYLSILVHFQGCETSARTYTLYIGTLAHPSESQEQVPFLQHRAPINVIELFQSYAMLCGCQFAFFQPREHAQVRHSLSIPRRQAGCLNEGCLPRSENHKLFFN